MSFRLWLTLQVYKALEKTKQRVTNYQELLENNYSKLTPADRIQFGIKTGHIEINSNSIENYIKE